MAEIRRYVLEDPEGNQTDEVDTVEEAREEARKRGERCALIALVYEYSDSELVDVLDASGNPTGEDTFP